MRNFTTLVFTAIVVCVLAESSAEAQLFRSRPVSRRAKISIAVPTITPLNSAPATEPTTVAVPNGWYPYVIARPEDREWIRETPMELRPNRPLHFWGNSRRRMLR